MGNWRTVRIVGTCNVEHAEALKKILKYSRDYSQDRDESEFIGPLTIGGGLCGLPMWPAQKFDVTGNLFERDYSVEDICLHLTRLAGIAPSLNCRIHCGGDYEDKKCIATIFLIPGQHPRVLAKPEIEEIGEIPEGQMQANLIQQLSGW